MSCKNTILTQLRQFVALFLAAVSIGALAATTTLAQTGGQQPVYYLCELLGKRPGWPGDMTKDEEAIMYEHFLYLKELTAKGNVIAAGPVEERYGLIILKVESEADARAIMDKEPSVVKGVHDYKLSPMALALLADYVRPDRYPAELSDLEIYREATVRASLDDVWNAWTTNEGAQAFFSPWTNIKLRTFGPYEIFFNDAAPAGEKGGEGNKVLSFLPKKMLSFEWNAPPSFGPLREIRTRVVIDFKPVGADSVKVEFHHLGFGTGDDWKKVHDYFDKAWTYVMGNFEKRFKDGPLKWE